MKISHQFATIDHLEYVVHRSQAQYDEGNFLYRQLYEFRIGILGSIQQNGSVSASWSAPNVGKLSALTVV